MQRALRVSAVSLINASLLCALSAREFHVSPAGHNAYDGSAAQPLRTISAAADRAQPGDTIIVYAGTYRERVTPPRGGLSDSARIVYRAAVGEQVVIKGSEVVSNWEPFLGDVWKATVPNSIFGEYNPYKQLIHGDWFNDRGRPHHTGEVYFNGKALDETHLFERVLQPQPGPDSRDPEGSAWTWFAEVDENYTYLYANFRGQDPTQALVEINVRDACFYPERTGCDYITVRGFRMAQAATQWAAPTAEQIGLIGTNWSKGWIIEHNVISDSKCAGVTLGKDRATGHNVWSADRTRSGDIHYNEVIDRALAAGWSRETIGGHVVRHNVIFDCGQAGICGSLGAIFSEITDNHIRDIWSKRQFAGYEMGGIKLHAAIDVLIARNRIHNTGKGIWLDWMAQGARVSRNLLYDNTGEDLFVEVNHGPFLIDNNLFLSTRSVRDRSQGGAYAHNLFAGFLDAAGDLKRLTPYHAAHATTIVDRAKIAGGDNRWFNNVFTGASDEPTTADPIAVDDHKRLIGHGLWVYDFGEHVSFARGNIYYRNAGAYAHEAGPILAPRTDPNVKMIEEDGRVFLQSCLADEVALARTQSVTTAVLGRARVPNLPYENPDGSPLVIDMDYFGHKRDHTRPTAGPFEAPGADLQSIKVW